MKAKKSMSVVGIAHALIIFIAGAVIGAIVQEALNRVILQSPALILLVVFISLALLSLMVYLLVQYTDELRRNVGIRIAYFDRDKDGRSALFEEARKIITEAKRSIYVLNSSLVEHTEEEAKPDDTEEIKAQKRKAREKKDEYYETLLEKAKQGVIYERVLQLQGSETIRDIVKDEGYFKHFHRLLDVKKKNPDLQMGLLKARSKRLSTFVLVDDENLMWQINEVLPSGGIQMHGIFIIRDPRHEITDYFKDFFDKAKRDTLGAVEFSELP